MQVRIDYCLHVSVTQHSHQTYVTVLLSCNSLVIWISETGMDCLTESLTSATTTLSW